MAQLTTVYRAAAVYDCLGTVARPGVVAVRDGWIVASGSLEMAAAVPDATVVDLPQTLILPTFVNAHAHLQLTTLGPRPYPGQFVRWLRMAMQNTQASDLQLAQAVTQGVAMSRCAGVGYLGDIASRPSAVVARRCGANLPGVSYLECFGITGRFQEEGIGQLQGQVREWLGIAGHNGAAGVDPAANPGVILGIQPHAPYSAGLDLYHAAVVLARRHGMPLTTHLAETVEEVQFVRDAKGPLVELLCDLGKWDRTIRPTGMHPIEWLEPVLQSTPWLLAHCNYVDDSHIEILARWGASVAYCPVANSYFGHHRPQQGRFHRYRDMLAGGVNVCLGTDSIVCQRPNDSQPLGIGSQIRYLYRRDATDPATILAMATVNGMRAMGLPRRHASLTPGAPARWVTVTIDPDDPTDPLVQALLNNHPMQQVEHVFSDPGD